MARLLRGDIVWADLDPTQGNEQAGRRPVLVISQDVAELEGAITGLTKLPPVIAPARRSALLAVG